MAENKKNDKELSMPIVGMLLMAVACAIIVPLCFIVIRVWPLPVSVAPYFGGKIALWWGLITGAVIGLFIGYLTDEKHFQQPNQ